MAADSNGVMFEERVRDYIIDAADYKISGVAVEPNENDRIIDSSSGTTLTFRCCRGGGLKALERSLRHRLAYTH